MKILIPRIKHKLLNQVVIDGYLVCFKCHNIYVTQERIMQLVSHRYTQLKRICFDPALQKLPKGRDFRLRNSEIAMADTKIQAMLLLLLVASANARMAANLEPRPNPRALKSSPGHGHGHGHGQAPSSSSECIKKCVEDHMNCRIGGAPICIPLDGGDCNDYCELKFDSCKKACS